jgi:Amt family ammonium transporter
MMLNGVLAALVAITAASGFVAPWAAVVIGVIAGVIVVLAVLVVERGFKVDDPVGAVAVHGANGLWGVLAVGLFADGSYGAGLNGVSGGVKGLFYGEGGQFLAQLTDAIVVVIFCSIMCILFFNISKRIVPMRSDDESQIAGLDVSEMGALAYPDFLEAQGSVFAPVGGHFHAPGAGSVRQEMGS